MTQFKIIDKHVYVDIDRCVKKTRSNGPRAIFKEGLNKTTAKYNLAKVLISSCLMQI